MSPFENTGEKNSIKTDIDRLRENSVALKKLVYGENPEEEMKFEKLIISAMFPDKDPEEYVEWVKISPSAYRGKFISRVIETSKKFANGIIGEILDTWDQDSVDELISEYSSKKNPENLGRLFTHMYHKLKKENLIDYGTLSEYSKKVADRLRTKYKNPTELLP